MSRVALIHWNATEWRERAECLRVAGFDVVDFQTNDGQAALRALREDPPDAVVIDLGRLPSHGREVGGLLRRQKATRHVPLVFVAGLPEKVARVRELLPDATYAEWPKIGPAVRRALRQPKGEVAVPDTMGSYSKQPLPQKLGLKPGQVVILAGAPTEFESQLGAVVNELTLRKTLRGTADVIMLFCQSRAELIRRLPAAQKALAEGGRLWIAWPKQASGVASDLTQAAVRKSGLDAKLVDFKICAIDATWSGLCFARRAGWSGG